MDVVKHKVFGTNEHSEDGIVETEAEFSFGKIKTILANVVTKEIVRVFAIYNLQN